MADPAHTTRHIVLNVMAYVVDVADSTAKNNGPDPRVKACKPAIHMEVRPCPACIHLFELEAEKPNEVHQQALNACLQELSSTLNEMMDKASKHIKKQARKWETAL